MDKKQFISYVEGTQKSLRRFLIALCNGNSDLADDIAQETYLKAYLSFENFKKEDKFKSWIFKIAYNNFLNFSKSLKSTISVDNLKEVSTSETPESNYRYQLLYLALDLLSEKERSIILLYYMEGYSSKEIAEIFEITDESVRKILSRGREHLKEKIVKNHY